MLLHGRSPTPLLLIFTILAIAPSLLANPLASQSFDYPTPASSLANVSGGIGFLPDTTWSPSHSPIVADTGLTHPLLSAESGLAFTSPTNDGGSIQRRLDASLFPASMTSGQSLGTSSDSGTLWVLYLHQLNNDYSFLQFGSTKIGTSSNASPFGVVSQTGLPSTLITPGQTNLIVIRITFASTADQLALWVNPPSLTSLPAPLVNYTTTLGDISIIKFVNADKNDTALFDEFRIGTDLATLADPIPLPEPASLILLSALLCLCPTRSHLAR